MTPSQNLGRGGGPKQFPIRGRKSRIDGIRSIKQTMIAQQHAEWQMPTDKIRQVTMDLMGVNFVNQVRHQDNE
jgi:hypothetical protein